MEYFNGWGSEDFNVALYQCRERDMERGATKMGPHRADVNLLRGKKLARSILSRGEQKILSAALLLAQAKILSSYGEKPICLLDDLASEFDSQHFDNVLNAALDWGGQVWVTGTELPKSAADSKVFHVKRGEVEEVL
jgi:DNA replication and repair protein RecF